jgi:hypothetical protein
MPTVAIVQGRVRFITKMYKSLQWVRGLCKSIRGLGTLPGNARPLPFLGCKLATARQPLLSESKSEQWKIITYLNMTL